MRFKQRGATLVEFALVLPLLMLILDGMISFSMVMYDKVILTNAVREAARAGSLIRNPKLSSTQIADVARSYCTTYLLSFGAAPAVSVVVTQAADPVFQTPVTVTASYTFQSLLMGHFLTAMRSSLVLTSTATRWNE
jgi:Flp pilus assembly protein TadG